MAVKRALVVDDSKAARVSLKKLLSEYDLEIALAASGEEALDYLKKESVDVIFMDHTMPGMDGLEAVSAIKANPRTATIPVMMYTTREGEVYVGQARALGAVGVLPKNVQPHQLFEMLRKLGMVQERRQGPRASGPSANAEASGTSADTAVNATASDSSDLSSVAEDADPELDGQVQGIAMQSVVRRILEDQHITLRSDVLRSQRAFAKDVAREVLREYQAMEGAFTDDTTVSSQTAQSTGGTWFKAAAVAALVISSFFAWQFKAERDEALQQLAERSSTTQTQSSTAESVAEGGEEQQYNNEHSTGSGTGLNESTLAALQESLNRDNTTGLFEAAFSDDLAAKLTTIVPHLSQLGFKGEIKLTSHLGKFCLSVNSEGSYEQAPGDMPVAQCAQLGHVLDTSNYVNDRMAPEFAAVLDNLRGDGLKITSVALYMDDSQHAISYPGAGVSAAEWNAVAKINNRVEVELLPATQSLFAAN